MRTLSRILANLLFASCVVILLGLAASLRMRPVLPASTVPSAHLLAAQPDAGPSAARQARAANIEIPGSWLPSAQIILLLFCCALCMMGVGLRSWASYESAWRERAELDIARKRQALEEHIQERTQQLHEEAEEQKRAGELNHSMHQILAMLADPHTQRSEDILRHLTRSVAGQHRGRHCSLLLMDWAGKNLQLAASSDVDQNLRRYLESIGTEFPDAPEEQACCSGQAFIVKNMAEVRRSWSQVLAACGIFSVWSIPFRNQDRVAGALTVYCRSHSGPSPHDLQRAEAAADLAALVIEHRRIHDELVHNAYHDVLTGVPNRRGGALALQHALKNAQQNKEPLSIFWIDLDRFKRINDQHGHAVGDEVLGAMARRLNSHPIVNGNLARMGGDEFLVVIPGALAADDAAGVCRQLLEAIAAPVATSAGVLSVGGSIGVCSYPRDGMCSQSLERNADFAMYRAKSTGGRFCIFSPAMGDEVSESLELEEALREAIEHKHFRVVYQPIYCCAGGLSGFEALVRFRSPRLGDVSPARFIPKAEEIGLIGPIGEWVLRQSCRQLHAWLAAGFAPVRMGVNISAVQIAHNDFAETVARILKECCVPPGLLTLELTETAVMDNPEAAARQMFLLKDFGVRLALDDFGTGHSSLSYLQKLPIDVLKIDRSFTDRLAEADGTRPIVEAVIAMARRLDVYVVAEGVETPEQQRILNQAGCDALQGYLFAPPLTAEEAQQHLTAHSEFLGLPRAISA